MKTIDRTDMKGREQVIDQGKEPKKEKKIIKNNNREQISAIKNFIGKDVIIKLRNGDDLKGKLETVTQYELVITVSYIPMIVMKHAIDYITLAGEK